MLRHFQHFEQLLRFSISLLGCLTVPLDCFLVALRHALAFLIQDAKDGLCVSMSLVCCLSVPLDCFLVALWRALAFLIADADVLLS